LYFDFAFLLLYLFYYSIFRNNRIDLVFYQWSFFNVILDFVTYCGGKNYNLIQIPNSKSVVESLLASSDVWKIN